MRRIPPALGALMAVSLLLSVTWAAVLPAFQAPDEQVHFGYVQSLVERHEMPGDASRPSYSTQMLEAMAAVNSDQVAAQIHVKPEWSDRREREWEITQGRSPADDGGGPSPAAEYPPLAYAWMGVGYAAAAGGTLFDELLGARLMSALWLPITVLGTWLLAGELLGRRRMLQTGAAAIPALLPMPIFISSAVGPDGMLYAIWTLVLWLGVRCVKRGVPLREGAALFAIVGLACTIKATSYALLVPAAFVAIVGLAARWPWRIVPLLRFGAIVALPLVITIGAWALLAPPGTRSATAQLTQSSASAVTGSATNVRELLSYLWQYYLPAIPGQIYRSPREGFALFDLWVTQGWGAFGWLEVKFATWVYHVLAILTGATFLAALVAALREWRRIDVRAAAFLLLAFGALLGGLHWTDFHQLEAGAGGFMQGRYLFPIIGIFGLVLGSALSLVPARQRGAATSIAVAGLLGFHVAAFGLVLERFYA